MKAFVYRSGHVMIGRSVPEGALELADWDNETELLMVCRWLFPMVQDAEGQPCMAIPNVIKSEVCDEMFALAIVKTTREMLQMNLRTLSQHPLGPILFHVGSIEHWSTIAQITEMAP